MYKNHKISVSIPAYNEEKLIADAVAAVPEFVDFIVVTNDGSKDATAKRVKSLTKTNKRLHLIDQENGGVGSAVLAAHNKGVELGADILVVMAGDNQMDPAYLPQLLDQLTDHGFDYAKGNRFFHVQDLPQMSRFRLIGNTFVTFLTKFATGYWSMSDPLNGYTALKAAKFSEINQAHIKQRYDFEISLFFALSFLDAKIKDVAIPAKYGSEVSTIRVHKEAPRVLATLFKGFWRRILIKYTLFNFNPISLFYITGYAMLLWGIVWSIWITLATFGTGSASTATVMIAVIPFVLGFQLVLQAITLDIQNEPK